MAVNRPVVSIGLDAAPVEKFMGEYKKFQEWITKTPEAFKRTNTQVKELEKMFRTVSKSFGMVSNDIKNSTSFLQKFNQIAVQTGNAFGNVERRVKSVATSITAMGRTMVSMVPGLGTIMTLALSGMGFTSLASGMNRARQQALGTGVSHGEQKAFELTYGRNIGGGSDLLSNIAAAKMQPGGQEYADLFSIVGKDKMQGSTTDIAKALLRRTRELYQGGQHIAYGDVLAGAGMTTERVRAIGSMPQDEFDKYESQYGEYQNKLKIADDLMRKFQKFDEALDAAGIKIKAAFVNGLSPLVGEDGYLTKLATEFGDLIQRVVGSAGFKEVMTQWGDAAKRMLSWMSGDNFAKDMKEFMKTVREAAGNLAQLGALIGGILDFFRKAPGFLPQGVQDFLNMTPADAWNKYVNGINPSSPQGATAAAATATGMMPGAQSAMGLPTQALPGAPLPTGFTARNGLLFGAIGVNTGAADITNPGGIMQHGGYLKFNTTEEGVKAVYQQLQAQHGKGHQTLRDLIYGTSAWGGYTATDRESYLKRASAFTGIQADQQLNFSDQQQMAAVVAAFLRNENVGHQGQRYTPQVVLSVINNTPNQVTQQLSGAAPIPNPSAGAPRTVVGSIPPPSSYGLIPGQ